MSREDAQPAVAGVVAALVGFAGSFTVVLAGLHAIGADSDQASSGLLVLSVSMGIAGIVACTRTRIPVGIAWSTPGAALLIGAGHVHGGYQAALGAFAVAGLLTVAAGLSRHVERAILMIPAPLASALLAGVLLPVCLAPARAAVQLPGLAAPVILTWLVLLRLARRLAVVGSLVAAGIALAVDGRFGGGAFTHPLPTLTAAMPHLDIAAVVSIGLPLFLVTMVSQNLAGMAVLTLHGYRPRLRPLLTGTGLLSVVIAPFGGHAINLSAITAALMAGEDAGPRPERRWIAGASAGATYVVLGLAAGLATAFIASSPPLIVEAVAGLALLGALSAALTAATSDPALRDPALVTFVTTASGITALGLTAPFWGLVAGLVATVVLRARPRRPEQPAHAPGAAD